MDKIDLLFSDYLLLIFKRPEINYYLWNFMNILYGILNLLRSFYDLQFGSYSNFIEMDKISLKASIKFELH
jgi:hypothetical protein